LNATIQTTDGGYLLGGYSNTGYSGDKLEISRGYTDYWVLKLNAAGNIQWQNTIGGDSLEVLYSVIQTFDGGYLLGGYSSSDSGWDKTEDCRGHFDCWVMKLDTMGNVLWQKTIGGDTTDFLYSIIQSSDVGYLVGGNSRSGISGDKTEANQGGYDYWVVKLNSQGSIQWQNNIGGSDDDLLKSVVQTEDGGYLLGGNSRSGISGDKTEANRGSYDYWIVKLDAAGSIQWQKVIGGNNNDVLGSIIRTSDAGGYLISGFSYTGINGYKTSASRGFNDYWVVKLGITDGIPEPTISATTLQLFPNPSTGVVTVSLAGNTQVQSVQVLDVTGRIVYIATNLTLDLSHLPLGIYTVVAETDRGTQASKLVLQ
jgi:Secretion system C-terminal sorting domain